MSDSNYNKIISTINSVSRDYTYSPDPNNLICIDTSNNRIGINTLDPEVSLHISGGSIRIGGDISASGDIRIAGDIRVNNIYANIIYAVEQAGLDGENSIISATNITATNNIDTSSIVVTNILDISRGRIIANNIDISSVLDISRGRIIANFIDISSTLDISKGRIRANFIDISSTLDISRGRIFANNIDVSAIYARAIDASNINITSTVSANTVIATTSVSAPTVYANNVNTTTTGNTSVSAYTVNANTVNANTVNATTSVSAPTVYANNINITSTVSANTVNATTSVTAPTVYATNVNTNTTGNTSVSAYTVNANIINVNANANASSDIITINIGSSTGVKINTTPNSIANDITINGVRLATTQHIRNVIPYGVIMAYYTTPAPPGWAICDGTQGTPNLQGRFILAAGQGSGVDWNNEAFVNRNVDSYGGAANHTLTTAQMPNHNHITSFKYYGAYYQTANYSDYNTIRVDAAISPSDFTSTSTGGNDKHNNMPPFYVLVYIMKTNDYDFRYNSI